MTTAKKYLEILREREPQLWKEPLKESCFKMPGDITVLVSFCVFMEQNLFTGEKWISQSVHKCHVPAHQQSGRCSGSCRGCSALSALGRPHPRIQSLRWCSDKRPERSAFWRIASSARWGEGRYTGFKSPAYGIFELLGICFSDANWPSYANPALAETSFQRSVSSSKSAPEISTICCLNSGV
ncbi:hypothetical protein IMSAGC007_02770 [Lachnospiraceae bacterium]|nr:hypothetical protein IMSAGC007_02770 [Lachnospiraceae bacterium]